MGRSTQISAAGLGASAIVAIAAGLTGCSHAKLPATAQAPLATEIGPPPAPPPPDPAAASVYRNPTIGVVYLRAHQDAEGRLLGPQVMYQIVDPGGWNMDVVEEAAGLSAVGPTAGRPPERTSADQRSALQGSARQNAEDQRSALQSLLDPAEAARVTITGLMRPEDRPQAEALATQRGRDYEAVFDAEAGWLLIPRRRSE